MWWLLPNLKVGVSATTGLVKHTTGCKHRWVFNSYEPEKGLYYETDGVLTQNYAPEAEVIGEICHLYEYFHKQYHEWLESDDWDKCAEGKIISDRNNE